MSTPPVQAAATRGSLRQERVARTPASSAPMTRAQLRELERSRMSAQEASVMVMDESPRASAPVVMTPPSAAGEMPIAAPAGRSLPSAASPVDAAGAEDVLAEVEAVMAQVQARLSQAGNVDESAPQPVVLRPGFDEPVDTTAPHCSIHGTGEIERLNVIPGTSVVLDTAVDHETYNQPSTRVGATLRVTERDIHDANVRVSRKHQWASRAAVLGSIGLATVAVPVLANTSSSGEAPFLALSTEGELRGPSTIDVISADRGEDPIPEAIAQSVSEDERAYVVASRSEIREELSGCDPTKTTTGTNGNLDKKDLCLVLNGQYLQAEAASAFSALNEAFKDRFGHNMCMTDGYRNLSTQYVLKRQKGGLAATPGTSNHGWGYAVDLCPNSYQSAEKWQWMMTNAKTYGWELPGWASRSYEPWHWEYTAGVKATS
ncbi:D-alanyl-D-alanine carboxypeptidase family protein [Timonella sp. A28]|uniref:M15 family metallopeptidase n=1 Tax=Timonella sp. A28 TaxID=3442640 RepID=UPI003EBEDB1E